MTNRWRTARHGQSLRTRETDRLETEEEQRRWSTSVITGSRETRAVSPRGRPARALRGTAETRGEQAGSTTWKSRAQDIDDFSSETNLQKHAPKREPPETTHDGTRQHYRHAEEEAPLRNHWTEDNRETPYDETPRVWIKHAPPNLSAGKTKWHGRQVYEQIRCRGASWPEHTPQLDGIRRRSKGESRQPNESLPKSRPNLLCRYTYLAVSPEPQDGRRFQPRILRRQSSKLPGAQTYQMETEEERMGKERQEDREEGALQRWRENTDPPETNLRFNFWEKRLGEKK